VNCGFESLKLPYFRLDDDPPDAAGKHSAAGEIYRLACDIVIGNFRLE